VIGGTLISLFVMSWVFKDKLNENLQIPLLRFGQDIARIYETLPLYKADSLVRGMKLLDSYHIRMYNDTGQANNTGVEGWAPLHEEQVKDSVHGKVVKFEGGHYLHHTKSKEIVENLRVFLDEAK